MSTSTQTLQRKKPEKSLKKQASTSKKRTKSGKTPTKHQTAPKKIKYDVIQIAKALQVVKKANAGRSYRDYVEYTNPGYQRMPYNQLLIDTIQEAIDTQDRMRAGEIPQANQYIMISMPPRHGKSHTVTETLPSYVMGRTPKYKVIMTAYSSTLAIDFDKANSKKVSEYAVFNGLSVKVDNQDRTEYSNGSVCVKAGILGGITGKGANLLIIDDPIKTQEEAHSETTRNKIWGEWTASLSTRLEPPAIVIVIMTRWHEDDLAGRLMNPEHRNPLPWKCINLPLEALPGDILGRMPGEPLWPERYGKDFIEERKQYPSTFNALYQGSPTPGDGTIINPEWFRYYEKRQEFINSFSSLYMFVDATFKKTDKSDYVSIQVWGKKAANMYMIERKKARMGFVETIDAIREILAKYPSVRSKYIEDKANGSAIIDVLNKTIGGFIPMKATASKESRVSAASPYIQAGNVFLPNGENLQDYLEECRAFPNGTNDDEIDCTAHAINTFVYINGVEARAHKNEFDDFFSNNAQSKQYADSFISPDINQW